MKSSGVGKKFTPITSSHMHSRGMPIITVIIMYGSHIYKSSPLLVDDDAGKQQLVQKTVKDFFQPQ